MLYTVIHYLTENFQWRLWAVRQKWLKFYALFLCLLKKIYHMLSKVFVFIAKFFSKMQASVFWAHCFSLLFLRIFPLAPCYFALFTHLLMRGGQSRPDAFPVAALLCPPPAPLSCFLLSPFLRSYADAHPCAQSESTRLRTVFLFLLFGSLIILRWMDLWKIRFRLRWLCGQVCKTPESSQPLMPLKSLAFPNYSAHFLVCRVPFSVFCSFFICSTPERKSWSCHRWKDN